MKPLQNYIEEEKKRLVAKFIKKVSDWREGNGHTCDYIQCQTVEEFEKEIEQSLHRIAKITAEEIVPEKKEKTKFQNDMYDALDDGYNQAISDLQTKIKEFGI